MKTPIQLLIIALGLTFLIGCVTNTQVVSRGITIQDYANAADSAVSNILASDALDKVANPPAVLFVSRIVNSTGQQIDTDLLTQKISNALHASGKVNITSTDPKTVGLKQENDFISDQTATRLPDFTLAGKIIEHIDRAGDTHLITYSFQLSLNDTKTGYQAWQGETEIGKQGTRPAVGF